MYFGGKILVPKISRILMVIYSAMWMADTARADNHSVGETETLVERPDLVSCMLAQETLTTAFRSDLQVRCMSLARIDCLGGEQAEACMKGLNADLRVFYERTFPRLPDEIGGGGFAPPRYERTLARMIEANDQYKECDTEILSGAQECGFFVLTENIFGLLALARITEVELR